MNNRLKSHEALPDDIETIMEKIIAKIKRKTDTPPATIERQLKLLKDMDKFDFGRFLLQNRGINGYWTHYILTHPWFGRKTGKNNRGEQFVEVEDFLLNKAPTMLATQQRFEIFLQENQKSVMNHSKLACIPSGMMGELLYLDFHNITHIELVGIDYDSGALQDASHLAESKGLLPFVKFLKKDAWQLDIEDEFDLISSNGLNIYEPSDDKVGELYYQFYKALKPGGKLVTSFLTHPPSLTKQCEWNMAEINQDDLLTQKTIFSDILEVKWQCFRSSEQTKNQLQQAGFDDIDFKYDKAKIFPTVVAYKK